MDQDGGAAGHGHGDDDGRRGGGDVGGSGEGGLSGEEGSGTAAAAAAAPRKATATIAFDKFTQVRNMLVMHIRKSEVEEGGGDDGQGSGIKQVDLTNWYIGEVAATQGIADTKELLAELKLVRTIIGHLIKKEGTLVVIQEAEPAPEELPDPASHGDDEEAAAKAAAAAAARERKRALDERILAVNPNFVFELS